MACSCRTARPLVSHVPEVLEWQLGMWIQDRCDARCWAVKLGQLPRCARMPLAASQTLFLLRRVAGFSRSDSSPDHLEVTMNDGWQKRSGVPIGRKGR